MQFPLVHISWALANNADRPACDAFFRDVFGAVPVYEILMTPEAEKMGLDREETLMLIGDAMVIPIAPAGKAVQEGHPMGDMLRRSAAPMRWLGLALKAHDLAGADAWFAERGFKRHYDPGMEAHYFLVPRGQALGMRLEIVKQEMPNEPRTRGDWSIAPWRDAHPLGIEGLQAVGISTPTLDEARALFCERLELPALGERTMAINGWCKARCAAFHLGDTVIEALEGQGGEGEGSDCPVSAHARDVKGIYHLVFKVKNAASAVSFLRSKGLTLIGNTAERFAIHPDECHGRLIWFTETTPQGYPATGSRIGAAA